MQKNTKITILKNAGFKKSFAFMKIEEQALYLKLLKIKTTIFK